MEELFCFNPIFIFNFFEPESIKIIDILIILCYNIFEVKGKKIKALTK